jgi:hypothetical protein
MLSEYLDTSFDSVTVKVGVVMCWSLLILEVVLSSRDSCWLSLSKASLRQIKKSFSGGFDV